METPTTRLDRFPSEPVVSREDIAKACGVSARTVSRWIDAGVLPPADLRFSKRSIRWRASTIEAALQRIGARSVCRLNRLQDEGGER